MFFSASNVKMDSRKEKSVWHLIYLCRKCLAIKENIENVESHHYCGIK